MKPRSVRLDTRAIEALLLAFAIFLSGFWWFGDGRYRDRYADQQEHRRDIHERPDRAHASIGSR